MCVSQRFDHFTPLPGAATAFLKVKDNVAFNIDKYFF